MTRSVKTNDWFDFAKTIRKVKKHTNNKLSIILLIPTQLFLHKRAFWVLKKSLCFGLLSSDVKINTFRAEWTVA